MSSIKQLSLLILPLLILFSCGETPVSKPGKTKTHYKPKGITSATVTPAEPAYEDFLSDTIFSLPEVKEADRYIDSLSNHESGVAIMVDDAGGRGSESMVSVGYSNDERFETYHVFFVDHLSKAITVSDPVTGDRLTLDAWRKSLKAQ